MPVTPVLPAAECPTRCSPCDPAARRRVLRIRLAACVAALLPLAITGGCQPSAPAVTLTNKAQLSTAAVSHVGFSSDGQRIYVGTHGGEFLVLKPESLQPLRRLETTGPVWLTFTTPITGDRFLAATEGISSTLILADADSGEPVAELNDPMQDNPGHLTRHPLSQGVAVGPAGEVLIETKRLRFVRRAPDDWDQEFRFEATSYLEAVRGSVAMRIGPDGKLLAVVDNLGHYRLFDLETGEEAANPVRIRGLVETAAISPDLSRVVVSVMQTGENGKPQGEVVLWDTESQEDLASFRLTDQAATAVCFWQADGAIAGTDIGRIHVWRVGVGEVGSFQPHASPVTAVAGLPSGQIVSGDQQGEVALLQIAVPTAPR